MPKSKQLPGGKKQTATRREPADAPPVREVELVLEYPGVEQVFVCGDFNQWQPPGLRMVGSRETGVWERRILLAPGRHEYKFIADGKWLHDPEARENVQNNFGSLNSVLDVRP